MTYQWQDIENELSKMTGEFIILEPNGEKLKIFIGIGDVVKIKNKQFQQTNDTRNYIVKKMREKAPEYFL